MSLRYVMNNLLDLLTSRNVTHIQQMITNSNINRCWQRSRYIQSLRNSFKKRHISVDICNVTFNNLPKRFIRTATAKMCNATRCMTHVPTSPEIDFTTESRSAWVSSKTIQFSAQIDQFHVIKSLLVALCLHRNQRSIKINT